MRNNPADGRRRGNRDLKRPRGLRRRLLVWGGLLLLLVFLLAGEGLLVSVLSERAAYRHTLELWQSGGSAESNLREPDPVYKEPEVPEVPEELFENLAADSTGTKEEPPAEQAPESEPGPENVDDYFASAAGLIPLTLKYEALS